MSLLGPPDRRPTEKFPITLVLGAFWIFAFLTLPFVALGVQTNALLSAQAQILLLLLIGGIVLLFVTSLIFTKGFDLIKPDRVYSPLNSRQALLVASGLLGVAVWQLFLAQAYLGSVLSTVSTASVVFPSDAAIAEDTFFGALAAFVYLTARYFNADPIASFLIVLAVVVPGFTVYHYFVAALLPVAQQTTFLEFVAGARLIITSVVLGTLLLATRRGNRGVQAASIAAGVGIHVTWNNIVSPL